MVARPPPIHAEDTRYCRRRGPSLWAPCLALPERWSRNLIFGSIFLGNRCLWSGNGLRLADFEILPKENDLVSAGFLVFAIGEGVILSGTAANLAESVPAFAAGTALWATALLLISIPRANSRCGFVCLVLLRQSFSRSRQ